MRLSQSGGLVYKVCGTMAAEQVEIWMVELIDVIDQQNNMGISSGFHVPTTLLFTLAYFSP